jgi:hypothetical protein
MQRPEPAPPSRAWRHRAPDEGRCRADPHCTNDGHSRYHWNDDWYFDFEHPASAFGARRKAPRVGRHANIRVVQHIIGRFRRTGGALVDRRKSHNHYNNTNDYSNNNASTRCEGDNTNTNANTRSEGGDNSGDDTTGPDTSGGGSNRCHECGYTRLGVHQDP